MGIRSITGGMRAVSALLTAAEAHAVAAGAQETAAEHIVLAALDDPGGSAAAAFTRAGLAPEAFREALARRDADALASVGVVAPEVPAADPAEIPPGRGRYRLSPGGRRLFERVAAHRGAHNARGALGAQVVLALTELDGGAAADALRRTGADREALAAAARAQIAAA